jgi:hypothetical protein
VSSLGHSGHAFASTKEAVPRAAEDNATKVNQGGKRAERSAGNEESIHFRMPS